MVIPDIKDILGKKSIKDAPLRVTFYARVSTDSTEQINSLRNQVNYYTAKIQSNPNWILVPGYVDEGVSGATIKKRDEFQRMMRDADSGLFDLILTKEITRFARNTLDSIMYTRKLLAVGVGVLFESDGINTFDEDSELRLTIMSGIAQEELRKLSSRVKFGQKQAIENDVVLGNSRIFGYIKEKGHLIVDEEEAKIVRLLFEMYATGRYSMKQLEDIFWKKGYRNHNGNKISHSTMSGIIRNQKYKGYYVGNKVEVIDLFTKKQKFLPPEEWKVFKDKTGELVPAIVSEELWGEANKVLTQRSEDVKHRRNISNHANLLTGKLFCACCNVPYYRRETVGRKGERTGRWVCSNKIKNGIDACPSFSIRESEMIPILVDVLSGNGTPNCSPYANSNQKLEHIEAEIAVIKKKQQKLLSHHISKNIQDDDFEYMNAQLSAELDNLIHSRDTLAPVEHKEKNAAQALDEMHSEFSKIDPSDIVSLRALVDKYIDRIIATPSEDNQVITLDIRLFTGDIFYFELGYAKKSQELLSK